LAADGPSTALWGPERSLETPSFVFHFRQHDAPAVIAVAPQLDALYMTLRHNLGLESAPGSKKLPIYDSWDTLLPAVYGVSTAEFEAGWRTYLADRYAVPLPTSKITIE
jgi:hypothetical protein